MAKIVLASGSPRRQELLRRMGITEFDIRVPEVEEYYPDHLSPEEIVKFISREKSDAAARLCRDDEIVITADTMVFLDERRLGKPRDEAQALEMLTALAGRKHTVCTGVTVRRGGKICTAAQHTDVYFRPASPWTRPAPTACRARARCWWSALTVTFSTSWACRLGCWPGC